MPRGLCLAVFFARALSVAPHGQGCAVGGASMVESERAGIRRNCDGLRGTESRSGGAGGDRAAQEAFCGALVSVALVQPSGFATRTESGEMTRLRESDGQRACRNDRRASG
ncbi:MAG: hypothetical protein D8H97_41255 [Neisseria sp.]|nr:MAG: hypothetical protein D8H97_41255 [Neisseria sp.]